MLKTRRKVLLGIFLISLLILFTYQLTKPKIDPKLTTFVSLDMALQVPDQVKVLGLRGQNLKFISPLIKNFSHLEVLDVSNNSITKIPDEVWQIRSLRHLDVSNNQIEHLELSDKVKLVNFNAPDILNLNDNKLARFSIEPKSISKVRDLRIARNHLQSFTISGDDGYALERLDLSGNQLHSLNHLEVLSNLIHLNLSGNRLTHVQTRKSLSILETVNLKNNMLTVWPETVLRSAVLSSVDLSGNEIEKLPVSIFLPDSIKLLDVSLNNIHPVDLNKHQNISRLNESMCPNRDRQKPYLIKTIFSRLSGSFDLVTDLNLSGLALATVPVELQFLRNLKSLDLSHNKLATLPLWFDQLQTLEELDLRSNHFESQPEILRRLPRLKEITWNTPQITPDGTGD